MTFYFLLKIVVTILADNNVAEYINSESNAVCDNNAQKIPIIALNNANKPATLLELTSPLPENISFINFRAVAQAQYHVAAAADFIVASLNFFVIRKIANTNDAVHQWAGYVLGSVAGSYLGIYISTLIH